MSSLGYKTCLGTAALLAALSGRAYCNGVESAVASYSDDNRDASIISVSADYTTKKLIEGKGRATAVNLGYTRKDISLKIAEDDMLNEQYLHGRTDVTETSISGSIDQGLNIETAVGLFGGSTESLLGNTNWYGARASYWWLEETLQTTLEVQQSKSKVPSLGTTEFDNHRVTTPPKIDGDSVGLRVMNFVTPSTILRGSLVRSTTSNRPAATAISVEGRQFITATKSVVHLELSHYENVGEIEKITLYGSVVSNAARVEWHQRFKKRFILLGGYRYYIENENPRAEGAPRTQVGSDSVYTTLRWRFGKGHWLTNVHELYVFAESYSTNVPSKAQLFGVGGRYQF